MAELTVVILAGGLGTRLKPAIGELPKILAPIQGIPFLEYFNSWLDASLQSIKHDIIISTGFLSRQVHTYIETRGFSYKCVAEEVQMGTLGALANTMESCLTNDILVLNGDTIFSCSLGDAYQEYVDNDCDAMLITKEGEGNSRFGGYRVCDRSGHLVPSKGGDSLISLGGLFTRREVVESCISAFNKGRDANVILPMVDHDLVAKVRTAAKVLPPDTRFIDIGIPDSYREAQSLLPDWISLEP